MPRKYWTINELGAITEVKPLMRGLSLPEIEANTKGEANQILLTRAKRILNYSPRLTVKDGAFLLVSHNGEKYVAESGTIDRANSPLCIAQYESEKEAMQDKGFAYYASAEYRQARGEVS